MQKRSKSLMLDPIWESVSEYEDDIEEKKKFHKKFAWGILKVKSETREISLSKIEFIVSKYVKYRWACFRI